MPHSIMDRTNTQKSKVITDSLHSIIYELEPSNIHETLHLSTVNTYMFLSSKIQNTPQDRQCAGPRTIWVRGNLRTAGSITDEVSHHMSINSVSTVVQSAEGVYDCFSIPLLGVSEFWEDTDTPFKASNRLIQTTQIADLSLTKCQLIKDCTSEYSFHSGNQIRLERNQKLPSPGMAAFPHVL